MTTDVTFTCPSCGFSGLEEPPRSPSGGGSYEICPSCGFEFGVTDDDEGYTYASWRARWVERGMPWWASAWQGPPEGWDPRAQLPALSGAGSPGHGLRAPRLRILAALLATILTGLAVSTRGTGPLADALGDTLYAVMVILGLALVLPRPRLVVAALGLAWCWAVELAQLTGLPAAAVAAWPPLRFVLGTTFQAVDLVAYVVGAVAAVGLLSALVPAAATRRRESPVPNPER